jgi:hypothetical protein
MKSALERLSTGPMFARPLLLDFVFAARTLDDAKEFE